MIGNAHIDPVWLWQWREGYHEVKATFRSALDRMNETPDFVFTCACACYYAWVEENDPEMFEEIRARVKEGRWGIVGGMWIQPDMNVPSGESIVRQTLLSQRYFKEKFGITATVGYNVDTFGHNAMLPQILQKAGMGAYVWMRPSPQENDQIPEGPLRWEGADGTEVLAFHNPVDYSGYTRKRQQGEKIDYILEKGDSLAQPMMCFYGVGNHGGGPTIQNLKEIAEYMQSAPRGDQVRFGTPMDYFAALQKETLPQWKGELQHHASGCYSTHSRSKRLHREAENALLRMEKLGALSQALTGHTLKKPFVRQAWENLLFNEFHDLMGGCSLPEALEDACCQLDETLSIADREENAALQRLSWQIDTSKGLLKPVRSKDEDWKLWGIQELGTPVVVFNPHGFEAEDSVVIRRPLLAVEDNEGQPIPVQIIRATRTNGKSDHWDSLFRARVPAYGYRVYWVYLQEKDTKPVQPEWNVGPNVLENRFLRAELDPKTGMLRHLIHKASGRDALSGAATVRLMDISANDTWAHNVFTFDQEAGAFGDAEIALEEKGPVRAVLRVTSRHGESTLCQRYILYADADQLEMNVQLEAREKHRMVKLCLPTDCERSLAEIPYGVLERKPNGQEEPCQRFVVMAGKDGGLALLNKGKYSYSVQDGELRMTLANTSIYADHYGQPYRDESCQFMDQEKQTIRLVLVPFAGEWQDASLPQRAETLNQPMPCIEETYHKGPLPEQMAGFSTSNPGVMLTALKRAEDENGYVLRAVETLGRETQAQLALPFLNRSVDAEWKPFEIKTFLLPDDPNAAVQEISTTEL